MTGFNHVLTGIAIAATVQQPIIAPIAALVSHFVLDSLPHFGNHPTIRPWKRPFLVYLVIDGILALGFMLLGLAWFPEQALLVLACAALAFAPDWLWPVHLLWNKGHWFFDFHKRIQWAEVPWGFWIEIPYTLIVVTVLYNLSIR